MALVLGRILDSGYTFIAAIGTLYNSWLNVLSAGEKGNLKIRPKDAPLTICLESHGVSRISVEATITVERPFFSSLYPI